MIDIQLVHQHDLSEVWPIIRQNIVDAAAYSNGRYTDKTVADEVLAGSMQLWVAIETKDEDEKIIGSLITQIMKYPTGIKCCDIYALGGRDIRKWMEQTINTLSEWAKTMNCSSLQIIGRPGWERLLKNWGKLSIMMELPLGDYYERG